MGRFAILKPQLTWETVLSRQGMAGMAALAAMLALGFTWGSWSRVCAAERCPSIARLMGSNSIPQQTSKIYAADGRLITELGLERRTVLQLREIPPWVRAAFLATEDKRFYQHHGIDYWRILGSLKANLTSFSYAQGFSTITMQLARNIFPDQIKREKSLPRKLKEARVALEIEHNFPKDTILQMYLNQIDLGGGAHGVEAAAQIYFGKSARDLNVAEAATLAAIPKAPSFYNPRLHPDRSVRRRNVVLGLMESQGFLSADEAERWRSYPLVLTTNRTNYGDVAPYFVEWLRTQFLEPRYGRALYEKGLRIYTTLDLDMQDAAERALSAQLDAIEAGVYTGGHWDRPTYHDYLESSRAGEGEENGGFTKYLQGALLAIDAKTGYIRAMIGGRDFADSKFNRVTQAQRQPGSTFKPFVYSAAVRAGHPVTEILQDTPLDHPVLQPDSSMWDPKDYDLTTLGPIPLRKSLFLSRNLSTIKLGMALGEQTVIGEARRYGLTTPIPAVPAIHIGAQGVYPIELISAYTTFANMGTRVQPIGIIRVEDQNGNILWQPAIQKEEVMDPVHAWLMTDMLRDVVRQGTAHGAVWGAGFQLPAGGKTGTTDDYTDAWFVGFTSEIVAGIWVGYDIQQRIMNDAGGGRIVAPAWTEFMRDVYDRRSPPADWSRPDSLLPREVDWKTGFLVTPFCPAGDHHWDWFFPGTEPRQLCPVHGGLGPLTP
jgi:penicillin-binding protein 1A